MKQLILGIVLLLLGILFLRLGKRSKDKFEENNPKEKHHSGVIFQSNTLLIYLGFVLTLGGIAFIIGS